MSTTLTHVGLPAGCNRFKLLGLFEALAKPKFKLSKTATALIRYYVLNTSNEDYGEDRVCAVWGQVCKTARSLNLKTRSINEAERELEAKGFIERTTGTNGARSGLRHDGKIEWAAGINLAPLINRYHELKMEFDAIGLRNTAVDQCKAEIRYINKQIRLSGELALRAQAEAILPEGRTARITELETLEQIKDALSAVVTMLSDMPRAQKTSDASEENCARKYTEQDYKKICSGPLPAPSAEQPKPELQITPRLAASLASDEYRQVLHLLGGISWPNIVEASWKTVLAIGVDPRTWAEACDRFGREQAAVCVIIVERNAFLHNTHRYHVRHVRRQNIWDWLGLNLADCWPHLGVDIRRRACGVASADIRWSFV